MSEWLLVRHAPVSDGSRLCGRTDVACTLPAPDVLERLAIAAGNASGIVASPARRCVETARAIFPGAQFTTDKRLWEQDFGAWDGLPHSAIPDIGVMTAAELVRHCPPGGESFAQACERIAAGLKSLPSGRTVVVAHAGTVRAALALALGSPEAAIAFEVAPLSTTLVRALPGGAWSIGHVNRAV